MKSKVRWFSNEDVYGYIEHKINGDITICFSDIENPGEHIKLELLKKDGMYELKRKGLD